MTILSRELQKTDDTDNKQRLIPCKDCTTTVLVKGYYRKQMVVLCDLCLENRAYAIKQERTSERYKRSKKLISKVLNHAQE